ncbi:unnamed protein product [Lasius platythorax]|uniref:Endonuclease-reverse transcriptase n=1 Tax=Lasius platythorax TaxID=488582 RepID=A0AAV2MX82_9HYME
MEIWHEPKITDHSAIVVHWDVGLEEYKIKTIKKRNYKNMDVEKFQELINIRVNAIKSESSNELADLVINEIIVNLDLTAPQRMIILKNKWQGKQWYSQYIRNLMKQRDIAYKIARLNNNVEDWELFRQLRNLTVDACRKAKREYLEKKLDKNKRNPKQIWNILKDMLKSNSVSRECSELLCANKVINKVEEMAERFNYYFIDSIRQLADANYEEKCITQRQYTDKV